MEPLAADRAAGGFSLRHHIWFRLNQTVEIGKYRLKVKKRRKRQKKLKNWEWKPTMVRLPLPYQSSFTTTISLRSTCSGFQFAMLRGLNTAVHPLHHRTDEEFLISRRSEGMP